MKVRASVPQVGCLERFESHALESVEDCSMKPESQPAWLTPAGAAIPRARRSTRGGCVLLAAWLASSAWSAFGANLSRFTADESLDSLAAAPVVRGFTAYGGGWRVDDGVLRAEADAGSKLVLDEPAFAEGEVGVELRLPDNQSGNAGFIVKVNAPGVGPDRFVGYEISLDARTQRLRLGRHRQDFELIRDVECVVPAAQWIALSVAMTENTLQVSVNGRLALTYEDKDHPLAAGKIGFRPWQRAAQFRKFWIKTGAGTRSVPFEASTPPAGGGLEALDWSKLPPVVFVARHPFSAPPAVGQDIWAAQPRAPGCSLRVFDPAQPSVPARTLFHDPDGCIYDMNLSFDAKTLFFSYRRKAEKYWHLWRIHPDGSGLQQLTDGPFQDISPCPMPNGEITFVSTRRFGYTLCQPGPASNLHVMAGEGGAIRCVSMNTLSDFSPQMLPDGRVLFTRWEYVDRDLTFRQSLWTQNPDGTGYQLFFGNTVRDVGTFWQARPLPGRSDRVVATFAPHHGFPHGAIGLIEMRQGVEAPRGQGFAWITQEFSEVGDSAREWAYRDPFPLSDSTFLVSYGGGGVNRYRLFLLDIADRKRLLCEDPTMGCYNPLPLRPTAAPPVLAPQPGQAPAQGTFLLVDVYRGLTGIARGRVKSLRVMEQVRKTEDLVSRAFDQSPVMSYATYYAKRCWGTVPVEADGSACFKAPALREIYFQALDADGRELQRMTSATQIIPGQTLSCIGCHESRAEAPVRAQVPLAAQKPPCDLERPAWLQDGMVDFPTVVQPVLDQYCVRCHSGANPSGGMLLTGDKTRLFNMAYDNLLGRSRSYRQHDMATGEMLPAEKAKPKPLVHFFWLLRTPTGVNQPLWTGSHASRMLDYLEAKHCEREIPRAERQRIYLWIDANVPYYGTYAHSRPKSPGRRDLCTEVATGADSAWFARDFLGVYRRACQSCHDALPHPNDHANIWDGRLAWIDFTHPEFSPALTAHLAKPWGRGLTNALHGRLPPLFATTTDADYQAMLRAIETGRQLMLATPEADMPGFKGVKKEDSDNEFAFGTGPGEKR